MHAGTVARLWRYPIKALAAQALEHVNVEPDGFAGDRQTALIVRNEHHPRSGKPLRGKEHHLLHTVGDAPAARRVTADSGVKLDEALPSRYFDAQPISLIFDSWLHDVEALVGHDLDPLRYRPNIFALAVPAFITREHALVGTHVAIGNVVLHVVATIGRCVTTTYDIATGVAEPAILREVATKRANIVGVYCTVATSGSIARNDDITIS